MATWADPRGDLRRFLADTAEHNLVKQKAVFGSIDGANRTFFTFDDRLVASGYQDAIPDATQRLRIFVNQSEMTASGVHVTNSERGEFELMQVPALNDEVLSSYHFQQHLDVELDFDLQQAAQLVNADIADNVPPGLQSAALCFAASFANERLAQRWFLRKSDQFMLHDVPSRTEAESRVQFHQEQAQRMFDRATQQRREYYDLRMDRGRSPSYALLKRIPNRIGPQR